MPQAQTRNHEHSAEGAGCCHADDAASAAGATPGGGRQYHLAFKIQGMDCAEEVAVLRREIGPLVGGGNHLDFDILNGKMMIATEAGVGSAEVIRAAVARTGMRAEEWRPDQPSSAPSEEGRRSAPSLPRRRATANSSAE